VATGVEIGMNLVVVIYSVVVNVVVETGLVWCSQWLVEVEIVEFCFDVVLQEVVVAFAGLVVVCEVIVVLWCVTPVNIDKVVLIGVVECVFDVVVVVIVPFLPPIGTAKAELARAAMATRIEECMSCVRKQKQNQRMKSTQEVTARNKYASKYLASVLEL
jgi:hypothetical protein